MTLDDRILAAGMVLAAIVFGLGGMLRTLRRLREMRPAVSSDPPKTRTVVIRPTARVPRPPPPAVAAPRKSATPKRQPATPPLEARVFRNRRLSAGARLVVASEILSRPKALRPRRPL